ncbi:MAG: Sapep family Mn(2+)-dependent dipeptidase [Chthonomonas sp.]|nr:Sapep family Mn(2+)-dependent dipeptidase [Chthonomonas sp.]
MPDATVSKIQDWLRSHETELLEQYQALLRIPSIEADAEPNAPFGIENRRALDMMLNLASEWGMMTTDLEGYCGYAEFGQGDTLVTILGHLDVVPVGPGWKFDPFSATIDNGYVYSRGATDDKGPTIAAFFAARAIQEVAPEVGARIRTVFGCNEESGFKCIERYVQTEEAPTYGIAPDAGWPLIQAEKGIATFEVLAKMPVGGLTMTGLTGGQRPNIVIDSAVGTATVSAEARPEIEEKLAKQWDKNLHVEFDGVNLKLTATGKAAHGSWPWGGDNAAIRILRFLMEISPANQKKEYEDLFETTHIGGSGLGIDGRDEISELTNNLGIIGIDGDSLRMTFNVRYPVTWKGEDLESRLNAFLADLGPYSVDKFNDSKPLYFPLDHPLVKTVCDVYEEETGERKKPGVMGGGTYARAIPNSVAIGTGWQGDGEAHQTDERLKIEHLFKMSRIYAHIIWRLAHA